MIETKLILNFNKISALILLSLATISCSHNAPKNEVPRNPANEGEVIDYSCLPRSETDDSIPKMSALSGFAVGPAARVFKSPDEKILRPFFSDGCSKTPDKAPLASESNSWSSCCYQHDIAYWAGGTESAKEEADANLENCIADKGFAKA